MSLTASALLAGPGGTNPSVLEARANSETSEQDPKQEKAQETIMGILKDVDKEHAMSLDQILAKDSSLDRDTATAALKGLMRDGAIRKTGEGTQAQPFRYYPRTGGEGG